MTSFTVDQYMQVKCKFQLSSDTEHSESIHSNNETVRLCTSADLDLNSTLIVMICSNGSGNNHIVAYLILSNRVIVKQIYYNPYNEDIVAICLNESGTKLTLINASSTIYILPIKNILLKQLRCSQEKSMYFYDASIMYCCSLDDPVAIAHWESPELDNKSLLIVANERGKISFINIDDKKEVCLTRVNDRVNNLKIARDRSGHFLLITCDSSRQYRFTLELLKQPEYMNSDKSHKLSCQPHTNNLRRIHKLISLIADEIITHLVLTERFLVVATDKHRCQVNSRNCCDLKNLQSSKDIDPLIKEITFSNGEKILQVLKSPVTNDQDGIIDSFLLVTTRSIYSIEARQGCRDMFTSLVDNHLGIKLSQDRNTSDIQRKNSLTHSNLMVNNFLNYRGEVYERVAYDCKTFSILFKYDLNSLYEVYGDKLLTRGYFKLATRFFQMAQFNYVKIIGKFTGQCASRQTSSAFIEESSEDPYRLWYDYIDFYLNHVGAVEDLESDILNLIDNDNDCRIAITLYKALSKAEEESYATPKACDNNNTTCDSMSKLHNLSGLFRTEFLMKLLDKTVDLVHQSTNPSAISELVELN